MVRPAAVVYTPRSSISLYREEVVEGKLTEGKLGDMASKRVKLITGSGLDRRSTSTGDIVDEAAEERQVRMDTDVEEKERTNCSFKQVLQTRTR